MSGFGVVRLMYIIYVLLVQLSEEGPCEELGGEGQISSFNEWILPAKEFDGIWERFAITNLFIVFYVIYILYPSFLLTKQHFQNFTCSLIFESGLKQRLLQYAASALLFTEKGVNPFLVSWNR